MILFRNLFFLFLFIANTYSLNALTFKDGKHIDEFIKTQKQNSKNLIIVNIHP